MEISDQTTCLDPYFASFEESLSSRNYKPETLKNYRYLLRRFGRLLEAEDIAPSALTPDLAVELGHRLPTTPKSLIKIPNLARLFVAHLIEIGVATRPALTPAQAERFASGWPREEIEKLFAAHRLFNIASDPLLDLVAAEERRMEEEGLERRIRRRYAVSGDVPR